jgi:hypothetical protein
MGVIERNPNGQDGFCRYCGATGLSPASKRCTDPDCEPSDHIYKECRDTSCRNIIGPVSPESSDKYCSSKCASQNIR